MGFVDEYYHYDTPIGPDGTPYDYYEAFRDWAIDNDEQIGWSEKEGGFWLAFGYEPVKEIYQNPTEFTNRHSTFPVYGTPGARPLMLAAYDEPAHSKYRKLVSGPFSPKKAAALTDQLRATTNDLIDQFINDGRADLVSGLANGSRRERPRLSSDFRRSRATCTGPGRTPWPSSSTPTPKEPPRSWGR
jgi:cytochrome P450